jgi:hypothetical protein
MTISARQLRRRPVTASHVVALFVLIAVALAPFAADAYVQPPIYRSQGGVTEVAPGTNDPF